MNIPLQLDNTLDLNDICIGIHLWINSKDITKISMFYFCFFNTSLNFRY